MIHSTHTSTFSNEPREKNVSPNIAFITLQAVFFCLLAILFVAVPNAHAQVAIIAHKSVSNSAVETKGLVDIFMLDMKNWSDGTKITVIDTRGENAAKTKLFSSLGVSYTEAKKIWIQKQFSGKALPPIATTSEQEALEKVASTPGAVGYISADKVELGKVKVLATIK
jgi:biopolymer transport protein ExbD